MLHQVERSEFDADDDVEIEDGEPMSEYAVLVETLRTLDQAEREINKEAGAMITPAYSMIVSAQRYIRKLAAEELRGQW